LKDLDAEAPQLGLPMEILYADAAGEIEAAMTKLSRGLSHRGDGRNS
jgi:putative ABC transport system substrate-binding protein